MRRRRRRRRRLPTVRLLENWISASLQRWGKD